MTAVAAQRCQQRGRSSLVVHLHVVGGEAMWAALTLMRVLTLVCPGAAVSSRPFLEWSLEGLILAVTHSNL